MRQGEAELARGDDEAALLAYERAAAMQHCADAEMGLVRSLMQAGQYRRAMAFVSHTAVAHREVPGGAVLYAWLLHAGGQLPAARRLLDRAELQWPGDPLLEQARRLLGSAAPVPQGQLLAPPLRLAPYASSAAVLPQDARLVASGTLIDDGRHALVPAASVTGAARIWVRDGRGRTRPARMARHVAALQLALLVLDERLPADAGLAPAARDPFPGSIGFALEYAGGGAALPAWPLLRTGFTGAPWQGWRRLGIELPAGPRGGPVFDASGRWSGLAVPASEDGGTDLLLPVSALRRELGALLPAAADGPAAGPPAALDEIYERALPFTLQVLAAPS